MRRTASDDVLQDKAFETASNSQYVAYQRRLASIVYNCFDKKLKGSGVKNKVAAIPNQQFQKRKVYSSCVDDIWGC